MINIKKATEKDIPLINRMAWIAFPATYKDILKKEQIDYMMEWMYSPANILKQMSEEGHIYYIAYKQTGSDTETGAEGEEKPVGYVSIQKEGEDLFHLQKIYVLPEYQKEHAGKALFMHAVSEIRAINGKPCRMELNVNRNNTALGFYMHMGMTKASEGDFDIGNGYFMNDYIMSLNID
ncbi:MAG: GNAT family N-acetyltransferase [Phocaeicola sp.]|nr:GNAT family N-acetyltransferase [Phocaeicola sp.]